MLKNAITLLAIAGVLCVLASPVWAIMVCPLLNSHDSIAAHPCCPKPAPSPVSNCIQHCDLLAGNVVMTQLPSIAKLAKAAPVEVQIIDGAPAVAFESQSEPVILDSSGLFLRVRVLRI